ncbi:hypothetical protein POM88_047773 [Heracleum sosnowskyi]|uniref:Uncharacterized protein n=1 Tax=Heracleum sosnowskyi TaxID=360622 RepID=A0AAD8GSS1_9APIA|nr:hypothetical protein POM88_047773 [Heracleum sosnowskyi]
MFGTGLYETKNISSGLLFCRLNYGLMDALLLEAGKDIFLEATYKSLPLSHLKRKARLGLNYQIQSKSYLSLGILACVSQLHQLRHLYLSESYRSRIMAPGSSSSLLDIQTLWGAFVEEETQIQYGLKRLTNLRKFGLVYRSTSRQQGNLADWISKLHNLESLRLRSVDDMNNPSLLFLKLFQASASCPAAGPYTKKTMVCSSGGFPLLGVLNLWKLEELEEWIVKDGSLIILRHLEIRSCLKLKMIPEGLKHLEHCRELKLTNMFDDFKARVTKEQGVDWQNIAHIASVVVRN